MRKHEIAILKTTIELTEYLYLLNQTKDKVFFSDEMADTLLIMLASNQALLNRLQAYKLESDNLLTINEN
jgi:phosphoserine phosphatase